MTTQFQLHQRVRIRKGVKTSNGFLTRYLQDHHLVGAIIEIHPHEAGGDTYEVEFDLLNGRHTHIALFADEMEAV